jgi:NAD(P)-dependent dehydrogenase (short-subunit alcohol dehydrogenase family)
MKDGFANQLAVITGAARGIGRAIAEHMHRCGARLLLVDNNAAALGETAEALRRANGGSVQCVIVDLADPAAIENVAARIAVGNDKVKVLVNNAGIEFDLPLEKVTVDIFDRVLAVNLRAPLLLTRALVPLFCETGGAVVNISSIHANHAFPNAIPYACSKAGLVALTRNLALELAPRRIRVNAVCPGYVDTPMWDEWLRTASDPEALGRETEALHPLGRRGKPEDVASAVAYLASQPAAWITGTCLVVDGGLTIRAHP